MGALAQTDEQATFQILELKKAFVERQVQLNNQASSLVMDFKIGEVHKEIATKQAAFQDQYVKKETAWRVHTSNRWQKLPRPRHMHLPLLLFESVTVRARANRWLHAR